MSPSNDVVPLLSELTESEREEAMSRFKIISPLLEYKKSPAEMWREAARKGNCSIKTVRRWQRKFEKTGIVGLARKRRPDKHRRRSVSLEMQRLIEALYLEHGNRSVRNVYRLIKAYAEKSDIPVPSYSTVYDICQAIPATVVTLARDGERDWRNQFEPILRFESSRPNECWQMDHCKLDLLAVDETGESILGRPWLTVVLDTYSRVVVGYYLSLTTPSSLSVCFALRRAILPKPTELWPVCGLPERLHIDRGRDFTSKHLAQVAADLGIRLSFATPYLPWAKGKIERFFNTLNKQLWCELPGYVGANVEERPHPVRPQLTIFEVEQFLLGFVLHRYHHAVHSTTGELPLRRWQQAGFVPRVPTERELDLLLMMSVDRIVQRQGIRFYHLDYWSHELVALIGQHVMVRYDPEDISEIVIYHNNQFVCVATTPQFEGLEVNLADWRALQAQHRRSVQAVVNVYQQWLETRRGDLVPIVEPEDVDLVILMERMISTVKASRGIALLPSDRPMKLLPSPQQEEDDA